MADDQRTGGQAAGAQGNGDQATGDQTDNQSGNNGDSSGSAMHTSSAPGTETWISALMLSPREVEKLVIYQVADLARRRRERGVKLNFPESIALISESLLEAARDGLSVAEAQELGKQVLSRDDVMDGVPDMVTLVQVEATFPTGTQLITVSNPIP